MRSTSIASGNGGEATGDDGERARGSVMRSGSSVTESKELSDEDDMSSSDASSLVKSTMREGDGEAAVDHAQRALQLGAVGEQANELQAIINRYSA